MAGEGQVEHEDPSAASAKRRQEQMAYVRKHRDKLEKVAQRCINYVLLQRPADPYEALLYHVAEHAKVSAHISSLRVWPLGSDTVILEVAATARGLSSLAVHRASLPRQIVAAGCAAFEVPQTVDIKEAEAMSAPLAAARLKASLLKGSFAQADVLDFADLEARLHRALPSGEVTDVSLREAAEALNTSLADALIQASGRLLDTSAMEAVRSGLLRTFSGKLAETADVAIAAPIRCCDDFQVWQGAWPQLLMPALRGSSTRRRLCIGVTLWASTLPEVLSEGQPEFLDELAAAARRGAPKNDQDEELLPPTAEERCPPVNGLTLAADFAVQLVQKVTAAAEAEGSDPKAKAKATPKAKGAPPAESDDKEGVLPAGEDFAAALTIFRKALEAAAPVYASTEPISREDLIADQQQMQEKLEKQMQRGSIYCALHFDADSAYDASAGTYCFAPGGQTRTQSELVDYYISLCKSEPLLRCLIAPFSSQDEARAVGLASLREQLPLETSIVDEAATSVEEPAVPGIGRLRNLKSSPIGFAAAMQRCKPEATATNGNHEDEESWSQEIRHRLLGLLGEHGCYDFGASEGAAQMLKFLGSFMDVSLAAPESARRLIFPRLRAGREELLALLKPLEAQIQGLMVAAYRQKQPADGREKARHLNIRQFREGLWRLGFDGASEHSDVLFSLLDVCNTGTISTKDLQAVQHIDGPACLETIDKLRAFLCQHQAPGAATSPLLDLWHHMDRSDSRKASFFDFKAALKRLRHPDSHADSKLMEMFITIDIRCNGTVTKAEFNCLNILSSRFQLERVCRVRDFLEERFGSLKAAFKALDINRSGILQTADFHREMMGKQGYSEAEDVKACAHFIDKDSLGHLMFKDFEFLEELSAEGVVAEVAGLRNHLLEKFRDLSEAYKAFEKCKPEPTGNSPTVEGLEAADFLCGCRLASYKGNLDPRILFNFLDATQSARIGWSEFSQLGSLGAIEALQKSTNSMQQAIKELKKFALQNIPSTDGEGTPVDEALRWTALHRELRLATHEDLALS